MLMWSQCRNPPPPPPPPPSPPHPPPGCLLEAEVVQCRRPLVFRTRSEKRKKSGRKEKVRRADEQTGGWWSEADDHQAAMTLTAPEGEQPQSQHTLIHTNVRMQRLANVQFIMLTSLVL